MNEQRSFAGHTSERSFFGADPAIDRAEWVRR